MHRVVFLPISALALGALADMTVAGPPSPPDAAPLGGEAPRAPLERFRDCKVCPEMIIVPQGSFMMGAIPGESRNPFDFYGENATGRVRRPGEINIIPFEHPRHRVEIDIPFAMGRNEVTFREWGACVEDGVCTYTPDNGMLTMSGELRLGPDHPVINVSYADVEQFTSWLNGIVGAEVYRLPTEAEWEYAARAGTETRFAQGDDLTPEQANFSRGATENLRRFERPGGMPELVERYSPVPVDALDAANAWGLRHMSGNVAEVTLSCWSEEHLGLTRSGDHLALALSQTGCRRVAKGGSFAHGMDSLRPASRKRPRETDRVNNYGFRVVRTLEREK